MYLYRLLYYSRAVEKPDLVSILDASQERNKRDFITGALWFDGELFVQALEGDRGKLSDAYHRIVRDPRHGDVVLAYCGPAKERAFPDWDMALYENTPRNRHLLKRFTCEDRFDPRTLLPEAMMNILKRLDPAQS